MACDKGWVRSILYSKAPLLIEIAADSPLETLVGPNKSTGSESRLKKALYLLKATRQSANSGSAIGRIVNGIRTNTKKETTVNALAASSVPPARERLVDEFRQAGAEPCRTYVMNVATEAIGGTHIATGIDSACTSELRASAIQPAATELWIFS